ncbi:hypothetical protein GOODEAATRI_028251 [Goodea atripinnis]|uniref:Uncharacterized protein n=1 Tax=Goodea atripinnis TaxID=208336 RepID=A0ABV0NPX5_9TELE
MLACTSWEAPLQIENGHELCPRCLGVGHFREALTDLCMNCSVLPLSVREDRLHQVEGLLFAGELPPSGVPQACSGQHVDTLAGVHDPRGRVGPLPRPPGSRGRAPEYGDQRQFRNFYQVSSDPGEESCPLRPMAALARVWLDAWVLTTISQFVVDKLTGL